MSEQRWFSVTWEMKVLADSGEDAESKVQSFAMTADSLRLRETFGNRWPMDDFGELKHGEIVPTQPDPS